MAYVVAAVALAIGFTAGSAAASTNPGPVNTTFNFNTTLKGATHFTVYGNGQVHIGFTESTGPAGHSESLILNVEVQTCGAFGCNWDGKTVGGNCNLTTVVGGGYGCTWTTGISNTLHRIDWTKTFDGAYISGTATIS